MGIEICEQLYWGKGLGTAALGAAIQYYQKNGFNDFCLETWSGNLRMLKCAEKLGFVVCKRKIAHFQVDGKNYDAVTMCLDENKFASSKNDNLFISFDKAT